jgi:hypothetical protein
MVMLFSGGVGVAPFAGAAIRAALCGAMSPVERAMFVGGFGLGMGGTAASIGGRVSLDLLEEGPAAIGNALSDHEEGTGFTDGCPTCPIGVLTKQAHLAEVGGSGFGGRTA